MDVWMYGCMDVCWMGWDVCVCVSGVDVWDERGWLYGLDANIDGCIGLDGMSG